MRGIVRLLMMFGPMIFRQVQKYQRNKERNQYTQQNGPPMRQEAPRRRRETPPPPPRQPEMTEEERNFRLKEEDIMLENETIQDYKGKQSASHEMDYETEQSAPSVEGPDSKKNLDSAPIVNEGEIVPSGKDKKDDDGFDLKDLFFEDEEK